LNKVMANDPDNCITLCKDCHKQVHSREGCKYSDLKC
jgi:5-methylcytosine-specific restriction endonuclease McrA